MTSRPSASKPSHSASKVVPETAVAVDAPLLRVAAVIQALEAVALCVAGGFSAAATVSGKSYQDASGIALTLIAFGTAAGLALIARGVQQAKLWSRTPALLTQLFTAIAGVYLLDGHRLDWGIPALILAGAGLAALLAPSSFNALKHGPGDK